MKCPLILFSSASMREALVNGQISLLSLLQSFHSSFPQSVKDIRCDEVERGSCGAEDDQTSESPCPGVGSGHLVDCMRGKFSDQQVISGRRPTFGKGLPSR